MAIVGDQQLSQQEFEIHQFHGYIIL